MYYIPVPIVSKPSPTSNLHGFKINRADGALAYASHEVTWNQVDSFICPGGSSVSRTYPILTGREVLVVQSMMNAPPLTRRAIAHLTSVSGTTVSVWGGSEQALILVLMR